MNYCQNGCGRLVSANKHFCMTCVKELARKNVEAREDYPMDDTTHILVKREGVRPDNHQNYKAEDLHRADGLLVASRQDDIVRYGQDISTARNHLFLNEDMARAFLRRLADVDMVCMAQGKQMFECIDNYMNIPTGVAVIEEREGGCETFDTPTGKITLATPGAAHKFGRPS